LQMERTQHYNPEDSTPQSALWEPQISLANGEDTALQSRRLHSSVSTVRTSDITCKWRWHSTTIQKTALLSQHCENLKISHANGDDTALQSRRQHSSVSTVRI
jgi:hypothetical protein